MATVLGSAIITTSLGKKPKTIKVSELLGKRGQQAAC